MRIGIVFHKDPMAPPAGIDLIRLRAMAGGLIQKGIEAEIIAPVTSAGVLDRLIPMRPLSALADERRYDLVKTCYHDSLQLIGKYRGPLVSRIVRVVDEELPERDGTARKRFLDCQHLIRQRAQAVIVNNVENKARWKRQYGGDLPVAIIPTGCPVVLPPVGANPFDAGSPVILFLGSLAAPRMIQMLNELARRLRGQCRVHWVGSNKTHLYGDGREYPLDSLVVDHGTLPEAAIWDFIRHAQAGLALAAGPHPFDNDLSKIYSYLRGGLPVLAEERLANNHLLRRTQFGRLFAYGDGADMAARAVDLLAHPPTSRRQTTMAFMAKEHSWERRVASLLDLCRRLLRNTTLPAPR